MVPDTLVDTWGVRQVGLWAFRSLEEGAEVPGRRRDNGVSAGVGREGEKQWRGRQLEEEFFRRNFSSIFDYLLNIVATFL